MFSVTYIETGVTGICADRDLVMFYLKTVMDRKTLAVDCGNWIRSALMGAVSDGEVENFASSFIERSLYGEPMDMDDVLGFILEHIEGPVSFAMCGIIITWEGE